MHAGPARRLVNTHHNGDHCWGNQLFEGAEIIGHRRCAHAMMHDMTPAQFVELLRTQSDSPGFAIMARDTAEFDFSGIELVPPTTLVDERMTVDLDGKPAELIYVGPAHTEGDLIVHLPEDGVVFGGDVIWSSCTPIGWEGTYENWWAALELVLSLEPRVVVPGHGPITDADGVRELARYLHYVRDESAAHHAAGLTPLEAAKKIDLGPYADWTEPERLIFNVHRAYLELEGRRFDATEHVAPWFYEMGLLADHRAAQT